jgi:hypothetical protein
MRVSDYDLVVIGSGPAGQKGAIAAAKARKRVALMREKHLNMTQLLDGRPLLNRYDRASAPPDDVGRQKGCKVWIASYSGVKLRLAICPTRRLFGHVARISLSMSELVMVRSSSSSSNGQIFATDPALRRLVSFVSQFQSPAVRIEHLLGVSCTRIRR